MKGSAFGDSLRAAFGNKEAKIKNALDLKKYPGIDPGVHNDIVGTLVRLVNRSQSNPDAADTQSKLLDPLKVIAATMAIVGANAGVVMLRTTALATDIAVALVSSGYVDAGLSELAKDATAGNLNAQYVQYIKTKFEKEGVDPIDVLIKGTDEKLKQLASIPDKNEQIKTAFESVGTKSPEAIKEELKASTLSNTSSGLSEEPSSRESLKARIQRDVTPGSPLGVKVPRNIDNGKITDAQVAELLAIPDDNKALFNNKLNQVLVASLSQPESKTAGRRKTKKVMRKRK
jgi:hypothetical protein